VNTSLSYLGILYFVILILFRLFGVIEDTGTAHIQVDVSNTSA